MLSRFNLIPVVRGSWKGLSDSQYKPDWFARAALTLLPGALFVGMLLWGGRLAAPTPILTAVSLLAGGMLSAFTHLSTLRLKITEWLSSPDIDDEFLRDEREMLDESAAHLLTGAMACAIAAGILVLGMNVALDGKGAITGLWAALSSAASAYVLLLFIMAVPRLYSAYVDINKVSSKLSGFSS
jgi:hypothetical protein